MEAVYVLICIALVCAAYIIGRADYAIEDDKAKKSDYKKVSTTSATSTISARHGGDGGN